MGAQGRAGSNVELVAKRGEEKEEEKWEAFLHVLNVPGFPACPLDEYICSEALRVNLQAPGNRCLASLF